MIDMNRRFWLYPLLITCVLFIFFESCKKDTSNIFPNTVADYDGNVYHTLQIGSQIWMLENLVVTHYRNGGVIPNVQDSIQWGNQTSGAYCIYSDSSRNIINYGVLYNWYAASDTGIAPYGYHVAADSDWNKLITYLGGDSVAGGKMKTIDTTFWFTPNVADTAFYSGFNAIPAGYRSLDTTSNAFQYLNYGSFWWSATSSADNTKAFSQYIYNFSTAIYNDSVDKRWGMGVRCLKDTLIE
jgi:uncharacterized protein (TIGR02145 family)